MNLAEAQETRKKSAVVTKFPRESATLLDFVNWSQKFCRAL